MRRSTSPGSWPRRSRRRTTAPWCTRDLKSANIQITVDGKVKGLDFGLARAFESDPASPKPALSHLPTMTAAATMAGVILGTAAAGAPASRRREIPAWLVAAGLGALCLMLVVPRLRTVPVPPAAMVRASLNPPPRSSFDFSAERSGGLSFSPDGRRAADSQADPESGLASIWVSDFERGTRSRLTFEAASVSYGGIWSPDGQRIVYSVSALNDDLWVRRSAGGDPEILVKTGADKQATDWSREGPYLAFDSIADRPGATWGVWVVPLAEMDKPRVFVDTDAVERGGRFSPDGRRMLYTSDESGRTEVYVVPFPGPGGKWMVSNGGATTAWWTQDGKEIVSLGPGQTAMSVAVHSTATTFAADTPRPLFREPLALATDVTRDGQRFLMVLRPGDAQEEPLTLVTNWTAGLKRP